jgi:hypothetical protein
MNAVHGVAATRGHLSDNGGLRGHSAGDIFPFIIAGTGDDKWHVQLPDGRMFGTYDKPGYAECAVVQLKYARQHMDISKMSIAHLNMVVIRLLRGEVL